MNKLFSAFVFTILWTNLSIGQTITIKDIETEEAIAHATISSDSLKLFAVTNSKGQADVTSFKNVENIVIRVLNYSTKISSYDSLKANGFILNLQQSSFTIDEMVISATKWSQSSQKIPSRIISISAKSVALQSPQTAADLLQSSGEVYIQKSQQGGGSPMIRGFSTNRLLYSIDGVRMNTAIFRSGNIQNVISLDPFAIEHTEVFFGPGSVMYGSDAIGGVMSFSTLTPEFSINDSINIKGSVLGRYSSANNEMTGHADVGFGFKRFASTTSFSYNKYDNLKMGSFGPDDYLRNEYVTIENDKDVIISNEDNRIQIPTGYSQCNIMQKFRYKVTDNIEATFGFHYSNTSDNDRYDRHIRYKNGSPRYGEWKYGPQKWMMNHLNLAISSDSTFYDELNVNIAHQSFEESRISRDIFDNNREIRTEQVQAISTNFDFLKTISTRNQLFYGIEYVRNNVYSTGVNENIITNSFTDGPSRYPEANWSSYAIYLNDQHQLTEKVLLQFGVRYNKYALVAKFDTTFYPLPFNNTSIQRGALTGSFGYVIKPSEKWIISSNIATGFRAPNVDDMGKVFDSEPGAVVVPNPDLKGEYAYNADFGIAKLFGESLKVNFTAYYTLLTNALVRRDYKLNGKDSIYYDGELSKVQAVQNAALAQVYGIQGGFELKLNKSFSLLSKMNYQKGIEEQNDGTYSPSRHAAPTFGSTQINYRKKKLTLQLSALYNGERKFEDLPISEIAKDYLYAKDENGNPYSPSWYTLNIKGMYHVSSLLSITAGIENITDKRYKPYSSGIAAPGRNFIVSAKLTF
jgi:hemoglobin/transferrin/lactoferrin receptor protein